MISLNKIPTSFVSHASSVCLRVIVRIAQAMLLTLSSDNRPEAAIVMRLEKSWTAWELTLQHLVQVMFFPSHHDYLEPAVTRRVMDYLKFMNSKVLFKQVRILSMHYSLAGRTVNICSQFFT